MAKSAFKMKGWSGYQNSPMKQDTDPRKSDEAKKKAKKAIKELENRPDFKKNEPIPEVSKEEQLEIRNNNKELLDQCAANGGTWNKITGMCDYKK